MDLHAVILAGGRGERFWPLSRSHRPKQLLSLLDGRTLLERTLERISPGPMSGGIPADHTWIVAGAGIRPAIESLALAVPASRYIWEPVGRNTAAAVGAAVERILCEIGGAAPSTTAPAGGPVRDAVASGGGVPDAAGSDVGLLVMPSDHWIPDTEAFWATVRAGERALEAGYPLVTFGIAPSYPETGYGYIERADAVEGLSGAWRVARFHEKPQLEEAIQYLQGERCYWNSGIFLFRASAVASALREHMTAMAPPLDRLRADLAGSGAASLETWSRYFVDAPADSIDHGVMEKAAGVAVVAANFAWSDLGSWPAWGDRQEPDGAGNRGRGPVLVHDASDCVLYSEEGGLLAVIGVKDLIVVRVGDATLVCPRDRAQEIRRLVQDGRNHEALRRFF